MSRRRQSRVFPDEFTGLRRVGCLSWFFHNKGAQGTRMTDTTKREPGVSWLSVVLSAWHDPAARIFNIDLLTALIAILLPWTTSGVVIAVVLWIFALVPTLEVRAFLRSLARPICVAPIAFFVLALVGTLWSDAPWDARLYAIIRSWRSCERKKYCWWRSSPRSP